MYVYPSDTQGCGYYRLIWPTKILQSMGHDIKLVHPNNAQKLRGGLDESGKMVQVVIPRDADVMVFQRLSSAMMIDGIKIMRDNGVAVVIDVDDDMRAIDQRNPAWNVLHPKTGGKVEEYNWQNASRACDAATLVTVSTDTLLSRYAVHGRGAVLRNCVPEVLLSIIHDEVPGTIGWGGALHTHPDDPQVVGPTLGRLQREGFKVKIVGPPRGTRQAFALGEEPESTGPVPIGAWPHELAKLSVGIAPLNDTRFNRAKSWLKMMEYAAVGVPCVGSPTLEYRRLHALGVGLLADSPRDWYRHCRMLLLNDEKRGELSAVGRAAIAELTIERNAWRWWEAWSKALTIQRGPLGLRSSTVVR